VKDAKIPIGWLIPIVGLILLLGWFLGQQGWSVSKINPPGIELVPPTATSSSQIIQPSQSTTAFQPTSNVIQGKPTAEIIPTAQCSHFQVASPTQTMVTVPAGMWVVVRKCSPARSACFYTLDQSSGGQYLSYEHNGNADRYWVNAFCTESEAKNFANMDAKAMLEWWPYTQQNPFP
jgi:hypothetical protein